ncbi:MAG: T9SS type A sorting domain-containing protein [candidate division WOR-3 bacterium]
MKHFLVVLLPLFTLVYAQLQFSNPVMCSNEVSEWWGTGDGCIGANNEIYEAWTHTGFANSDGGIYFAASYDTNRTWSSDITIHYCDPSWVHAECSGPKLATTGDTVYCLYWLRPEHATLEYHLYCSRSDNRGANWNIFDVSITGSQYAGSPRGLDVAIGPDKAVNLVFSTSQSYFQEKTYFCRSTNGGISFSGPMLLPFDPANTQTFQPSMTISNDGRIFIVVTCRRQTSYYLYLVVSNDSGRTFDTTNLTSVLGVGYYPIIRIGAQDKLYLCYETANNEVKVSSSTDGGSTWQTPTLLVNDNFGWDFNAQDTRLLFAYNDESTWELYYRYSDDGGLTWTNPSRVWQTWPFPGDWLTVDLDIRNDLATISMHPEPGNVEAQYCSHAFWAPGIVELKTELSLIQSELFVTPNPFKTQTVFNLANPTNQPLNISIYNSMGRLVRELEIKDRVVWNGCDENSKRLPAGVYLCQITGLKPVRVVLSK